MPEAEPPPENIPQRESRHGFARLRPPSSQPDRASALQFLPLYCAAGFLLFFLLRTIASYLLPPGVPRLWGALLVEIIFVVSAMAPAIAISIVDGHPFADYGLPPRLAFGKLFWLGVLWGLFFLSALLLVLHFAGALSYGGMALHGMRIWKFAAFWAVFFLVVALFEEFAFRGYSLFAIRQFAGFWPAAFFLSAIFAFVHHYNSGETWWGSLGAGVVGLFFCFTLRRTGSLWFAVGMHAAWDWAQSFLYGVPDSGVVEPGHLLKSSLHGPAWLTGGTVGPEGSVLLFVLIAVMWIAFDRLYPAKTQTCFTTESQSHRENS
jgi:membrane protease YdiL (CAAX protease family)